MSAIETFTPSALNVTAGAVAKVQSLREEEDNPQLMLRVYVTGGGCSGFQYEFTFDKYKAEDDLNYDNILIDKTSADLLKGSEKEALM